MVGYIPKEESGDRTLGTEPRVPPVGSPDLPCIYSLSRRQDCYIGFEQVTSDNKTKAKDQ